MKYVILGGNAAGMSFAAKMKRNEPESEIIVIEKRDYVSLGSCGLPYYVADFFDDSQRMIARTPEKFIESGIDLRLNEVAVDVDFENKSVSIESKNKASYNLNYDKLIVSTGASPLVFDFGEYSKDKVMTIHDMADGLKAKEVFNDKANKRVTIVGGGFIGLEMVEAAKEHGKDITLVERNEHVMANQLSTDMVGIVEDNLKENNVNLLMGTTIKKISDNTDGSYKVTTDKGEFDTDIIILSLGFKPNTDFIDVEKERGAIKVDINCQTSQEDVYSIGDCALSFNVVLDDFLYLPLATTANKYGRMLADKLAGNPVHFKGMLGSSCIKVLDYDVAVTGVNEKLAKVKGINVKTNIIKAKNQTGYYPDQHDIFIKLTYLAENNVIIGAELVGKKDVVHRCDALAVAILNKMTTQELGYIDFCYAPPFAGTWDALNVAGNASK